MDGSNHQLGPLPDYWEKRFDDRTGWYFFVNHATQTTTWDDPRLIPSNQNGNPPRESVEIPVNSEQNAQQGQYPQPAPRSHGRQFPPNNQHSSDKGPGGCAPGVSSTGSTNTSTPYNAQTESSPAENQSIAAIKSIRADAENFYSQIAGFHGIKSSKEYKYIEEMMERNLIKLDNVETEGDDDVRNLRKECVRYITESLDQLELKAMANETDS